jgi:hypothetical protein
MSASQRVIGIAVMIKADILPAIVDVTIATLITVTTGMYIVEPMAIVACRWSSFITLSRVTIVAGHFHVLAAQAKIGVIMIEVVLLPGLRIMAIRTALSQITLVYIMVPVTTRA